MKLLKLTRMLFFATILSLIYINLQMQIIQLAYDGKRKENQIVQHSEINAAMAYRILELKSSSNLGERLLAQDSGLEFRDQKSVVQLVTLEPVSEKEIASRTEHHQNPILSFLSLKSQAEARPEKMDSFKPWRRDD